MRSRFARIAPPLLLAGGVLAAAAFALAANPPGMTVDTGAKVRVLAPAKGRTLTANTLPTRVSITHFKVDCRYAGTANRKGIGHYHIELDHSLVNMFCGPRATLSMLNVRAGKHTLLFIPAANDHADDRKAQKQVSFVYGPSRPLARATPLSFPGKPTVRIVSPRNGATVGRAFDLVVAVRNFRLSCALYGKGNVKGYGHWHANVDTATKGMMGMGTMLGMSCRRSFHVSLAGIKPGTHRFLAILEDNHHAPTIGAQASVRVRVR